MRRALAAIFLACSLGAAPASTKVSSADPDLAIAFFNAIPDICFQTARGHGPTAENAGALLLDPLPGIPPSLRANFGNIPTWFRLKSKPENIFVGVGDRMHACHLVLTDTTQAQEVQSKAKAILAATGFTMVKGPTLNDTMTVFAKQAPDGYMLVALQGPFNATDGGAGVQAVADVNLMPKAMFEAMLKPH
ncbi:MAG TPA: hypothetical protein VK533_06265 [Sphingomonas sp.]|uniref:hypothetical protein n=1 Tax=Sphingomonas sp. TaxID=28214 RepID=UPI002B8471FD|nr:hypothetical protein [Sphingomonas sp.]HMI19129.1 hypothetical protein [Sphingomonas sp.]